VSAAVVVFTRDLRLRDQPALTAAVAAGDTVLPMFVFDDRILGTSHANANRMGFLLESLADLRESLKGIGADLVVRRGNWAEQVSAAADDVGATTVHVSADVSAFAAARDAALEDRLLAQRVELLRHPGVMVLPAGSTAPGSGGPWKVFTPYYRKWLAAPWRPVLPAPVHMSLPHGVDPGAMPVLQHLIRGERSPEVAAGGETAGLARLKAWAATSLELYDDHHDDLAAADTSCISAYLHFGCLSPLEVATRLEDRPGGSSFVRQLCWRDFYHQTLAARPETSHADYRDRGDLWRVDDDDATAWIEGRTGFPIVDAAMVQLRREGFMHNRARMVVASFLTKDLYLDWRIGAAHFMSLLVDGDVANNQLNWQWTAGTGADTNPNRIFNPTVQSTRFDPTGEYIRRYLPQLGDVPAPMIHEPDAATRARTGYPMAIIDHRQAITAYRAQLASYRSAAG